MLNDEIHRDSVVSETWNDDISVNQSWQDEISEGVFHKFVVLLQDADD